MVANQRTASRAYGPRDSITGGSEHSDQRDSQGGGRSPNDGVMIDERRLSPPSLRDLGLVLAPSDWPIVLRLLAEALNSPCAASVITTPNGIRPVR
jgi:hypothetical protein